MLVDVLLEQKGHDSELKSHMELSMTLKRIGKTAVRTAMHSFGSQQMELNPRLEYSSIITLWSISKDIVRFSK